MNRNVNAFGLALIVALAMTAVFASGAQAQIKVTTGSSPAWLTGEPIGHPNITGNIHTLTLAGGQVVTCEEIKFTSTVSSGATQVTVVPSYKKCAVKIGSEKFPATVTMNDCDYVLHGGVEVSSTTFKEGEVDLLCPTGISVEIHVYKKEPHIKENELCTYFVAPFVNKKANEFHNVAGSPNDVTITTTATGIAVTRTGSLLCGATPTTATYTGSTTVKAFEDMGGTISNGTVTGLVEGAQVSLTASK